MDLNAKDFKKKLLDNKQTIFILLVIFFLAVSMRSNIVRYEGNYLFEPDAYYHARLVQELVQQGYVNPIDPNVYYQVPGGIPHTTIELQHFVVASIYFILSLGFYNKAVLALAVQIAPILFGAIISISMYFLAKEVFNNKKIGYITAFLAAITPAFIYRTMAGAEGNDSLGFVWMVIGLVFLVKAIKQENLNKSELINSSLSGIFFGLMAVTWRANVLIPLFLIPSSIIILLYLSGTSKKEKITKSEPFNFLIKIIISLGLYSLISILYGFFSGGYTSPWFFSLTSSIASVSRISQELVLLLIIISTIVFIAICFFFYNSKKEIKEIAPSLAVIILYIGLIGMLSLFVIEPDFFYSGAGRQGIGSMVGEESLGNLSFGIKYNSLIIFPIIALAMFPVSLYFFRKKDSHTQIILWFWTIITLFMAWYKLKFTFIFGLGLVAGAAIACYLIFELVKKYDLKKGMEGKLIVGAMVFLLIIGIGGSEQYITQFAPFANSSPYWIETMDWIQSNTSEDAKFFNWWSDGHQLAFVTERKFSSDNRNEAGDLGNVKYAEFNITNNIERGYEIASKEIGADYIILLPSNFNSGPTFEFYFANKIDNSLIGKYYEGIIRQISCSSDSSNLICNGQAIPRGTFQSNWHLVPDEFYNGSQPIYYYEMQDGIIILNNAVNESNLAKVYFNSTETQKYYKEVYYNNGLKIFEVLK